MVFPADETNQKPKKNSIVTIIIASLVSAVVGGIITGIILFGMTERAPKVNLNQSAGKVTPQINVPSGGSANIPEVAKVMGPSVVGVINKATVDNFYSQKSEDQGSGSGVIIDSSGYIVTNYHVVKGASQLTVILYNGKQVPAKIVGTDERTDLAVLKINEGNLTAARLGNSDQTVVGEPAIAIGNPLGQEFARTVTVGVISAVKRTVMLQGQPYEVLQTDAAINPGNSGGALVNSNGELIGINSAKIVAEEVEGINFAIPINIAKPIIEDIMKHGRVVRPWLGVIWVSDVNDAFAAQYGLPVKSGVVVEVQPNGPSSRGGLANNDIIVALDGEKIATFQDLRKAIEKKKIGDKVELKVIRNKKEKIVKVTLGESPPPQPN